MRRIKSWARNFFGFSRGETNAFLILLPLMFILIFSEPVYRYWFTGRSPDYSIEKKRLDSLLATWKWASDSLINERQASALRLFSFNPNQCSKEELISLGFSNPIANRIVNYRSKGGKFLVKKDLLKIHGMDSSFYEKMSLYIALPESIAKETLKSKSEVREKPAVAKFDLNTADTSQLVKIYGIGPKLSQRIIIYREKLGGFISGAQLKEVYGLDSTVVKELLSKSFIEENFKPRRVDVNAATEKELGSHPYIKYKLAKAIVAYRMQHGAFNTVEDLKNIAIVEQEALQKMRPYVLANP